MPTALALGTFDGLHMGHRAVLDAVLPFDSVVVSFRLPPRSVMTASSNLIMTPADKVSALTDYGIKRVELLDFENARNTEAIQFLNELKSRYSPHLISCGYNYRFGKNAEGNTELLRSFCEENGIKFYCSECVFDGDTPINSTNLRALLREGEIEQANRQIYKGFGFSAPVLHGDARGRTIGFPTVNQKYPSDLVPLKFGVYTAKVIIDGESFDGISNIGIRPTWQTNDIMSETYIKDFSGDLYDRIVTIKPQRFIRPEQRFNSKDELLKAIRNDIKHIE